MSVSSSAWLAAGALGARQHLGEALLEGAVVDEAGEAVGGRHLLHAAVELRVRQLDGDVGGDDRQHLALVLAEGARAVRGDGERADRLVARR